MKRLKASFRSLRAFCNAICTYMRGAEDPEKQFVLFEAENLSDAFWTPEV